MRDLHFKLKYKAKCEITILLIYYQISNSRFHKPFWNGLFRIFNVVKHSNIRLHYLYVSPACRGKAITVSWANYILFPQLPFGEEKSFYNYVYFLAK